MKPIQKFQRGLSLVTAIFLLVVLAGLGAVIMSLFSSQQQSSAMDVMGARAYQAARAGIEWASYQILQANGSGSGTLPAGTLGGTLNGFTVTVTSTSGVYADGPVAAGINVNVYNLTSTAIRGIAGQPDYVERQVSVTLAK